VADRVTLYLDIGDLMTKGVATGAVRRERFRFPSVVARRLLKDSKTARGLLLDERATLPRTLDFDPDRYPRTRSFPGGEDFVAKVRNKPEVSGARFAGWLAAAYGQDRRLIAVEPSVENIDALVHKAVLTSAASDDCEVNAVLIIDWGRKAHALAQYTTMPPRRSTVQVRSYRRFQPRRVRIAIESRIADAAACGYAAVADRIQVAPGQPVVVIDVGYLRTKIFVVGSEGCELQHQVDGVGTSVCVRRVMRDAQHEGLIEDELAMIRALEKLDRGTVTIEKRRFDVSAVLEDVRTEIVDDLARAAERTVLQHFEQRGERCRNVAIIGGGAFLLGRQLAVRLERLDLGFSPAHVGADAEFSHVDGARRLADGAR
jgi:hypothetical protein